MAVAISAQIPPSTISAPPDVASVPADATKTASGLATRVLTPGTGKDHPTKDEIVVVNYTGWTVEGRMFDGSAARGQPDAKRTVSGLSYRVLEPGTGTRHPGKFDEVTVNYTGWTTDGKRFDSSLIRGTPATFPLDRVIPGWTEGIQLMVVGEKVRFWIPENLAYQGKQAPYGTLVFDVELIRIR